MTEKFFVYGTLMKKHIGLANVISEGELRIIGDGKIEAELYDLGGYPGAVEKKGEYTYGEVFEINDSEDLISKLDEYEEFDPKNPKDSLFIRRKVTVIMATGETTVASAYFYNEPTKGLRKIASGRWKGPINESDNG